MGIGNPGGIVRLMMIEKGETRHNFDLGRFSLAGRDYGLGFDGFRGKLKRPVPVLLQSEADLALAGWGCAVFAARNAIGFLREDMAAAELTSLAMSFGASVEEGASEETVIQLLTHLGFRVEEIRVRKIEDVRAITIQGGVMMAAIFGHDWRKLDRSSFQTYDSHWVTVPAVDDERLVVLDSELRHRGVGQPISGVYTLPWSTFDRIDYYYVSDKEAFLSKSEDFVWGESVWYQHEVLAVYGN